MTGRRVRFVLSTGTFALLLCAPTLAVAQTGQGCGTHLGQSVQLPPGLPDGSFSVEFVPGGTVWQTPDGQRVTVPQTTFAPCSSTPTTPPVTKPPSTTPTTPPPTVTPSPKAPPPATTTPATTTPPPTTPSETSKQPPTTSEPRRSRAPEQTTTLPPVAPPLESGRGAEDRARRSIQAPGATIVVPSAPVPDAGKTTDELIQRLGKELREQTTAPQEPVRTPSARTSIPSTSSQPDQPHKQGRPEPPAAHAPATPPSIQRDPEKPVGDSTTETSVKDPPSVSKGAETPRDPVPGAADGSPKAIPTSDVVSSTTSGGSSGFSWLGLLVAILPLSGGAYIWTRRRSHAGALLHKHAGPPLHKHARDGNEEKPAQAKQGKGEQPQQPVTPKKDEPQKVSKRYALLVGVGFRRAEHEPKEDSDTETKVEDDRVKEFGMMKNGLQKIDYGLGFWGFDEMSKQQNTKAFDNNVATKENILRELQGLVDHVTGMPQITTSCFVKIHLMGHGSHGTPPATPKQELAPKPPDATSHAGLVTWDGRNPKTDTVDPTAESLLYDYEIAHFVKKMSDELSNRLVEKGGKLVKSDSGILVQGDLCFAESVLSGVVGMPLVYAGWSAGKNQLLYSSKEVGTARASAYALGFADAFDKNAEKTTIEDAHRSAAKRANDESSNAETHGAGQSPTSAPITPATSAPPK